MTETSLYKRTLIVLGATVFVPLVAVSISAANSGAVVTPFQNYLTTTSSNITVAAPPDTAPENGQTSSTQTTVPSQGVAGTTSTPAVTTDVAQATGARPASTYTVKDGDTYGCIAEHYYSSFDQWTRVFNANAGGAGYGEYDLAVGAPLTLPAISADEALPKTVLCE